MKMKLGRYEIELAKDSGGKQIEKPKADGKEQGSAGAGRSVDVYFANETKEPTVKNIMNMIDNDGTAAMLYLVMTVPIQASNWYLQPDPSDIVKTTDADGNETITHPQADFVDAALRNPEHKGGMSTPFSNIVANICLAIAQGHRFFEIVYKLNDDGLYVFKKVVARDVDTYEIKKDDTGGFAGVTQNVDRNGKSETVFIDIPYCFLFTYRKERAPLLGLTAFRAAYYHYDKKHRLYYLMNQQGQVSAIPIKSLEQPDADVDPAVRDANLSAVDKLAVRPSIALPFGWKLTVHDIKPGIDLSKYVDHHDTQMARSVLSQGQLLGNQSQSQGGSYALAESHWDTFMFNERAIMTSIEEHVTSFLVAKLIDFNFADKKYPEFKFSDLSDSAMALIEEAFKSLITNGSVPSWVSDGIAERVAEKLEIERPELDDNQQAAAATAGEQIQQQALNGAQVTSLQEIVTAVIAGTMPPETAKAMVIAAFPVLSPETVDEIIDPAYRAFQEADKRKDTTDNTEGDNQPSDSGNGDAPAPTTTEQSKRPKASAALSDGGSWWRELTAPEAKVEFAKIEKAADKVESELTDEVKDFARKLADDTTKRLRPLLESEGAAGVNDFSLKMSSDLEAMYRDTLLTTYSDAKRDCAGELKLKAPADKNKSKNLLKQYATSVTDKQYSDLIFAIKAEVNKAERARQLAKTELSISDVLATISSLVPDFFDEKVPITAGALFISAHNVGRNDVFEEYSDKIYGYLYSAILDNRVCDTCYDLDGAVCTPDEYAATVWMPPIHFWCRCIWVAIMRDEEDKPDFTGIPDNPGGESAPSLAHKHEHMETLTH